MEYRLFTPVVAAGNVGQGCLKINGAGCTVDSGGATLLVGQGPQDRRYSTLLSFNTSGIPDGAVVTSVKLKVRSAGVVGKDPLKNSRDLVVDVCQPPVYKTGRGQPVEARAWGELQGSDGDV